MMVKFATGFNAPQQRRFIFLLSLFTLCIIVTIGLDLLEANFKNSSFYISESFLFSSFWWLFIPLLYAQFYIAKRHQSKASVVLRVLVPVAFHLFAYPALVWLISGIFYTHTFAYLQTFQYGLTQYLFILFAAYAVPFLVFYFYKNKENKIPIIAEDTDHAIRKNCVTNLVVIDGNKRTSIQTKDISYITSNPPYINIHHSSKKYIHKQTLKSVAEKLDNEIFVRVHKSAIVNINKVHAYRSRQNGDYDLLMHDGNEIRLSRNFAADFKLHFSKTQQQTGKNIV